MTRIEQSVVAGIVVALLSLVRVLWWSYEPLPWLKLLLHLPVIALVAGVLGYFLWTKRESQN